jgi:hypothetical protein
MEDFLMEVALILYGVFAGAVVIWCSVQRERPSVNYVAISRAVLDDLMRCRDDLVVVELRGSEKGVIPGALNLPIDQLQGLLRWMPPRTTLVLCGTNEVTLCQDEIETSLLRLSIEVVYVLDDGRSYSIAWTAPRVATRLW